MSTQLVGLIATYDITGFLSGAQEQRVPTPWGEARYHLGELQGRRVALLQRYGREMEMVQHLVNFRANLWGFRQLGVRRVIATDGVGSLRQDLAPGSFVVVDDFLDFTQHGSVSFFEEHGCSVRVDLSTPLCPEIRAALVAATRLLAAVLRETITRLPSERRCPCAAAVPQTVFGRLPAWYEGKNGETRQGSDGNAV